MRPTITSTVDPAEIHPDLPAHQQDMARRCPYLEPSLQRGLTRWSAYHAEPDDQPQLFATLVNHIEALRADRRTSGVLACRNIAVLGPEDQDAARRLVQWPAWLARNLYAPVRVMVGRFWPGLQLTASTGEAIPSPPVAFFSVRTALPTRDGLFLAAKLPQVMAVLAQAPPDDGRDVFHAALGHRVADPATAYADLTTRFPVPATDHRGEHSSATTPPG